MRRLRVTLHKALSDAVRDGLLSSNPVDLAGTVKVPVQDVTETVWNPDQTTTFLEAVAEDRLYPLWRLVAWTGLRREEACGLQWGDVDLTAATLSVKRARVQVDGGAPITKGPKSPASRRVVDFDTDTRDVLKRWKVAQLEEQLRAGTAWAGGEWLFTNEIGEPVYPEYVGKRFAKLTAGLDLPQDHHAPASPQPRHRAPRRRDTPEGGPGTPRALLDQRDHGHLQLGAANDAAGGRRETGRVDEIVSIVAE